MSFIAMPTGPSLNLEQLGLGIGNVNIDPNLIAAAQLAAQQQQLAAAAGQPVVATPAAPPQTNAPIVAPALAAPVQTLPQPAPAAPAPTPAPAPQPAIMDRNGNILRPATPALPPPPPAPAAAPGTLANTINAASTKGTGGGLRDLIGARDPKQVQGLPAAVNQPVFQGGGGGAPAPPGAQFEPTGGTQAEQGFGEQGQGILQLLTRMFMGGGGGGAAGGFPGILGLQRNPFLQSVGSFGPQALTTRPALPLAQQALARGQGEPQAGAPGIGAQQTGEGLGLGLLALLAMLASQKGGGPLGLGA